jgi:hypothetical protein
LKICPPFVAWVREGGLRRVEMKIKKIIEIMTAAFLFFDF